MEGASRPLPKREKAENGCFFACLGVFGVFGVFGVVENEPLRARAAALPLQVLRRQKHLLLLSRETTQRVHGVRRRQRCCEHGWSRSQCKEGGGGGICERGRRRNDCRECGGRSICEHVRHRGLQRMRRRQPRAAGCEHGRKRSVCNVLKCCWVNLLENLRVT